MKYQRDFYDNYYNSSVKLAVEHLKRSVRLGAIMALIDEERFERALVVGCGLGDKLAAVDATELVALDISFVAVRKARSRFATAKFIQRSGTQLPVQSESFDLALCSEVIEHVPQPGRLVDEFHRVLKEEATLIISTPNWTSSWGVARIVSEILLQRPVTSEGQPIGNWSTSRRLFQLLQHGFYVEKRRGAWYFPPTGLGSRRLPDTWIAPFFHRLLPLEGFLSSVAPGLGHVHVWRGKRK